MSEPETYYVEIGGQRMTGAQYEAARRPLLDGVASIAEAERMREVWGQTDWSGSEDSSTMAPCRCGHDRSAHIYEEGACRPGFVCEAACDWFTPAAAD